MPGNFWHATCGLDRHTAGIGGWLTPQTPTTDYTISQALEMVDLPPEPQEIWREADDDHNNILSMDEVADLCRRAGIEHFDVSQYDVNGDGMLAPDEFKVASKTLMERASPAFVTHIKVMAGTAPAFVVDGLSPADDAIWRKADTDEDGFLNADEMRVLLNSAHIPHFRWQRFDSDADGRLTKLDFREVSMALKKRASNEIW